MAIEYFISDYDNNELEAVEHVLKSGKTGYGEEVEKLEEEFKAIEGCEYCIAVNSATSGLYLASLCSPYSKAVVPSNTFIATYQAAKMAGKKIDICDIELIRYFGKYYRHCKKDKILHQKPLHPNINEYRVYIGGKYNEPFWTNDTYIIGDCAHCIPGLKHEGRIFSNYGNGFEEISIQLPLNYGDIWVYSFFGNKNIHAGNGGMICCNNKDYYDKMKSLVYHGFHNRDGYNYNVRADAFKFEMNNITAAIVRQQLKKLEWKQQERKRVYELYYKNLKEFVYIDSPENHSYHLAIVEFKTEEQREKVEAEFKKHEIGFSMHYRPLYIVDPTLYKDKYKDYNHTKRYKRWLSLPIYPKLSSCDAEYICDVIRGVIK